MAANAFRRAGYDAYSLTAASPSGTGAGCRSSPRTARSPTTDAGGALAAVAAVRLAGGRAPAAPVLAPVGSFDSPVHVAGAAGRSRAAVRGRAGRAGAARQGRREAGASSSRPRTEVLRRRRARPALDRVPARLRRHRPPLRLLTAAGGELADPRAAGAPPTPTAPIAGARPPCSPSPHPDAATTTAASSRSGRTGCSTPATGDGGGANDAGETPQNPGSLLGKILRIDPRRGRRRPCRRQSVRHAGLGVRAAQPVALLVRPRDRRPVARRRRPGRARGDRLSRRAARLARGSELRLAPPARASATRPRSARAPAPRRAVLEHDHADGYCAITGGFVVRDPGLPTPRRPLPVRRLLPAGLRSALPTAAAPGEPGLGVGTLTSFGEDACGRVYVASLPGRSAACRTARRRPAARRRRSGARTAAARGRRRCARAGSA